MASPSFETELRQGDPPMTNPTPTDRELVAEIERLLEKATPGPWVHIPGLLVWRAPTRERPPGEIGTGEDWDAIVALRNHADRLLALAKRGIEAEAGS